MNFVSTTFGVLLAFVLFVRLLPLSRNVYLWFLIFVSTIFYGWFRPEYLAVIYGIVAFDWVVGLAVRSELLNDRSRRKVALVSIASNLVLLGYFKYRAFVHQSVWVILRYFGVYIPASLSPAPSNDVKNDLPLGISFHTFQSMAYAMDVAKGVHPPMTRFRDFCFTVMFFPQLVAGPIVRPREIIHQIERKRPLRWKPFSEGVYLMARGYFMKCAIADNLAFWVDTNWEMGSKGALCAWILALAFGIQIFCDFDGYSSIARGLAYILGFKFPLNFNCPYLASSFRNFWERWHITLSTWFRDYVYIPLGGNRGGIWRTCLNVLLTMSIAGLWHGASWTFIIWGAWHGVFISIERLLGFHKIGNRFGAFLWHVVVILAVLLSWVWFRAMSLNEATGFIGAMLGGGVEPAYLPETPRMFWVLISFVVIQHWYCGLVERGICRPLGAKGKAALTGVFIALALVLQGVTKGFIYFQF